MGARFPGAITVSGGGAILPKQLLIGVCGPRFDAAGAWRESGDRGLCPLF